MDRVRRRAAALVVLALAATLVTGVVVATSAPPVAASAGVAGAASGAAPMAGPVQVSAGYGFSCELRNGLVRCWGDASMGEIGTGAGGAVGHVPGGVARLEPIPFGHAVVGLASGTWSSWATS